MLIQTIKNDMKQAMLNKEKEKLSTLRMLVADLEKEKVALKLANVIDLTEDQTITVINRSVKKLDKEIESYIAVSRETDKQEVEKQVLLSYLPKQLSDEEIMDIIKEVMIINPSMGMIMAELSTRLKGKADMKKVSQLVQKARG